MLKPDSLRAILTAAVPDLRDEPKRLVMSIEKGSIRATAAPGLAFEYRYKLQLLLLDFAGHPDQIMVPLLAWVNINQNELLANADKNRDGISFEADMLDTDRVDIKIELALTERVTVARRDDGGMNVTHLPEPLIALGYPAAGDGSPVDGTPLWSIIANGIELLRWEAPGIVIVNPFE